MLLLLTIVHFWGLTSIDAALSTIQRDKIRIKEHIMHSVVCYYQSITIKNLYLPNFC